MITCLPIHCVVISDMSQKPFYLVTFSRCFMEFIISKLFNWIYFYLFYFAVCVYIYIYIYIYIFFFFMTPNQCFFEGVNVRIVWFQIFMKTSGESFYSGGMFVFSQVISITGWTLVLKKVENKHQELDCGKITPRLSVGYHDWSNTLKQALVKEITKEKQNKCEKEWWKRVCGGEHEDEWAFGK